MTSSDKYDDVPTIINIQNAQVKHLKGMIIIKLNEVIERFRSEAKEHLYR